MIKRLIILSIITIIMVAGIVQVRSIDRIHASTNPLSSGYTVIKEGVSQEDFSPSVGDVIGILSIPRLNSETSIIEGNVELVGGITHQIDSSFPGENGSVVLNVLESSIVKRAKELQIGDEIVINLPYGSFTYQIKESHTMIDYKAFQSDTEHLILTTPDKSYTFIAEKVKATN
ncbi:hypothetical protein IM538_17025 [Cytobacillus suaedae]|nr:hypothetical protein IM538_17025 [Cytobacillus suaedae]